MGGAAWGGRGRGRGKSTVTDQEVLPVEDSDTQAHKWCNIIHVHELGGQGFAENTRTTDHATLLLSEESPSLEASPPLYLDCYSNPE